MPKKLEPPEFKRRNSMKVQIKKVIRDLLINSSTHGLPNILRAKFFIIKILWIIFFFLSACFCSYLVYKSVLDYLNYEVVTKIRFINENVAPFPTITICNKSPFTTEYSLEFLINLYQNLTNNTYDENLNNFTLTSSSSSFYLNTSKSDFFNNLFKNDTFFNHALTVAKSDHLTNTERKRLSLTIEEMLIKCNFASQECSTKEFEWFYDFYHGNCFIFNSNNNSSQNGIKNVYGYGIVHSLQLELFVGIPDMYPNDINDLGIKIIINNSTSFPLVGNELEINVGTVTNVAINRIFVNKLKKPYSDCDFDLNSGTADSFESELYKLMFKSNYSYRQTDCMCQCYQKYLINRCNCYDLSYFNVMEAKPCLTIGENDCLFEVYKEFTKKAHALCLNKCPLECNSIIYTFTSSFTDFPRRSYANFLRRNHSILSKYTEKELSYEQVKQSVLKLNIFYESLSYQLISELPNTTLINLLASIGGALGLCLGVSCLSFIEILEIIAQIFLLLVKKFNKKS